VVICLERGADLHMAQLIPLLLTVSWFSKIQIGFAFLVPAHLGSPGTHTNTRLTALCLGLPGWAGTRKEKPVWILLKQETVSGSGISWAICKSAPRSRQITTPAPPPLRFLQAGCPSCCPANSVKALMAELIRFQPTKLITNTSQTLNTALMHSCTLNPKLLS